MARITFSTAKQKVIEFAAEDIEFERQEGGMLLTAGGSIEFQDTQLVEMVVNENAPLLVDIRKDGQEVLPPQKFHVTFFALEPEQIAVLLTAA